MESIIVNKIEPGDFSFMADKGWATACQAGYKAVEQTQLWSWLASYEPDANKGFMFSSHPNLALINNTLEYDPHSGASWACMMRELQHIAKYGWESYLLSYQS